MDFTSRSCGLEPVSLRAIDGHDVLLQTGFWGDFKALFGWSPLAFRMSGRMPLLALMRNLPAGFCICYLPHGPLTTSRANWNEYFLKSISARLVEHLPRGCLFIRFDLPWGVEGEGNAPRSLGAPFRKAPMDIQPASTVVVDLRPTEEVLLARMKSKTRYNVRLSEKHGVSVSEGSDADLDAWYGLYKETAARDRIAIHPLAYYRGLFDLALGKLAAPGGGDAPVHEWWEIDRPALEEPRWRPAVRLLLARLDGELLAGIIVALHGRRATYLYGASSNQHRNLMATYLLQWEAMRLAKHEGCESYDLFGIPFHDDPSDPMYGLYRFKTGFGGTIVNRPGSWDYPLRPIGYALYRRAEAARRWYYKRFKKRDSAQRL